MSNWECLFVHRKHRSFLSVYVDDVKMVGHKQNMAPMWKKLMKNVDLDEPTRIFGMHSTVNVNRTKVLQRSAEQCSNHEFLVEQLRNYRCVKMVLRYGRTCEKGALRDIVNWREKTEQLYKVSNPCLHDHHFKKEDLNQLDNCQKYAHKLS